MMRFESCFLFCCCRKCILRKNVHIALPWVIRYIQRAHNNVWWTNSRCFYVQHIIPFCPVISPSQKAKNLPPKGTSYIVYHVIRICLINRWSKINLLRGGGIVVRTRFGPKSQASFTFFFAYHQIWFWLLVGSPVPPLQYANPFWAREGENIMLSGIMFVYVYGVRPRQRWYVHSSTGLRW